MTVIPDAPSRFNLQGERLSKVYRFKNKQSGILPQGLSLPTDGRVQGLSCFPDGSQLTQQVSTHICNTFCILSLQTAEQPHRSVVQRMCPQVFTSLQRKLRGVVCVGEKGSSGS